MRFRVAEGGMVRVSSSGTVPMTPEPGAPDCDPKRPPLRVSRIALDCFNSRPRDLLLNCRGLGIIFDLRDVAFGFSADDCAARGPIPVACAGNRDSGIDPHAEGDIFLVIL